MEIGQREAEETMRQTSPRLLFNLQHWSLCTSPHTLPSGSESAEWMSCCPSAPPPAPPWCSELFDTTALCYPCRALAKVEGICAGISSGGAISAALRLSHEVENAVIAVIVCDRGDRYLSTGEIFPIQRLSWPLGRRGGAPPSIRPR